MNIKNIKEAEELVTRYRTITLEEIKEMWETVKNSETLPTTNLTEIKKRLTGFNYPSHCNLCKATSLVNSSEIYIRDCKKCIYFSDISLTEDRRYPLFCLTGVNRDTYKGISSADTPRKLLKAYRKRADHIEGTLNNLSHDTRKR